MKNNKRNLKVIWRQLDNACGSLDNATINISSMEGLPDDLVKEIESIDISQIVNIKNRIEELIEEKG